MLRRCLPTSLLRDLRTSYCMSFRDWMLWLLSAFPPSTYGNLTSDSGPDPSSMLFCADESLGRSLAIVSPPRCLACAKFTHRRTTIRIDQGDDGRLYYICPACRKFSCFGDARGIHLQNPACDCSNHQLSRVQVAGEKDNQVIPRALHFRCAVGGCDYMVDDSGRVITLPRDILPRRMMIEAGL